MDMVGIEDLSDARSYKLRASQNDGYPLAGYILGTLSAGDRAYFKETYWLHHHLLTIVSQIHDHTLRWTSKRLTKVTT